MRLLFASERPAYPVFLGGAARCAHRIIQELVKRHGTDCRAVGSMDYDVSPWSIPPGAEHASLGLRAVTSGEASIRMDCGYPVSLVRQFDDSLAQYMQVFAPDVVWAQLEGAKAILELAACRGFTTLLYVHDAESDPAEIRDIAKLRGHIVCSSKFLAKRISKIIGREAHAVYPCPEVSFGVLGDSSGYITMINPHRVKGIDTFLDIARRLPGEKFLIVESWKLAGEALTELHGRLVSLPNVTFMRRVADMSETYRQTKLLLVPSTWEEGFGMVAVEAQSCGIPVIASARGGLPESVGGGGLLVKNYRDIDEWIKAIGVVLRDARTYKAWSERALRHATSEVFTARYSAQRFHDICQRRPESRSRLFPARHLASTSMDMLRRLSRPLRRREF